MATTTSTSLPQPDESAFDAKTITNRPSSPKPEIALPSYGTIPNPTTKSSRRASSKRPGGYQTKKTNLPSIRLLVNTDHPIKDMGQRRMCRWCRYRVNVLGEKMSIGKVSTACSTCNEYLCVPRQNARIKRNCHEEFHQYNNTLPLRSKSPAPQPVATTAAPVHVIEQVLENLPPSQAVASPIEAARRLEALHCSTG